MSNFTDCTAKKCAESLPSNEIWTCAGCGEFFCESHIVDLLDDHCELVAAGELGSIYVCGACLLRRKETMMTLLERFNFYKEVNPGPLAYFFARRKHAVGYAVPEFLCYVVAERRAA